MDMSTYQRAKYKEQSSYDDLENPVGSIKRDGSHFVLSFDSEGNPSYISRRESVRGGFPDRTNKLPHLVKKLPQLANHIYSIELIHTGHNTGEDAIESHPAVSGILNSLPQRALETQKLTGPIRAVLLDVKHPALNTYAEKIEQLKAAEKAFGNTNLFFTPSFKIGKQSIDKLLKDSKDQEREGIIVTSLTKPENENHRVKIKFIQTYNLKVTGIQREFDSKGNPKNSAGALELVDSTGRDVGKVGTGFLKSDREDIWRNKNSWIGKLIQVKAFPSTATKLRSARYNGLADGNIDTI